MNQTSHDGPRRVVVISDLHCGHRAGLTPPAWWFSEEPGTPRQEFAEIQRSFWRWYAEEAKLLQPVHVLILNGDAIDGKSDRSGGTELITADRNEQVEMACACVQEMAPQRVIMSYGTPYHTGKEEDFEAILARRLVAEIFSHPFVKIGGVTFDVKHKVGASQIPHGRFTAPARERVWNALWAERGLQPRAEVFLRSHVHYFGYAGDAQGLAITTPALQLPGTKYGARQCSGTVDVGLLFFECWGGMYNWRPHLLDLRFAPQRAVEL